MTTDGIEHEGPALIDLAIEWIERFKEGEGQSEAFFDWLTESPRHVEVFMQALTLEQRVLEIAPREWERLNRMAAATPIGSTEPAEVIPLPIHATSVRREPVKRRWLAVAVAAGIATVAAAGWLMFAGEGWHDYRTAVGEQRALSLIDGSLINLNTGSHVEVRMSDRTREVRLIAGEALFKVQHDVNRPFRVRTREGVIQVLGTQFNVNQRASGATVVSVLEGRIRISAHTVSAGQQVDIGSTGDIVREVPVNAERVTAWQKRRLIFDEETLINIVAEFNRYNRRQFRIETSAPGMRRFSGIFDADDPDSLALLLSHDAGLEVQRNASRIVIRSR